mmetsp:Transcript_56544/g.131769  ORF Transcript_56544/g.131769 Transcript_56544/m.131769 type:complete len:325 (+) Transcript_56544:33-1007(+)
MAARGHFSARGEGKGSKHVFVADASAEIEVDAESVSSEWVTESEDGAVQEEEGGEKQPRKRARLYRVRHCLSSSSSGSSSSDSSSSESSSSTSTGSSSGGEADSASKQSRHGRQLEQRSEEPERASIPPATLNWLGSDKRYRCVALVPGFLGPDDIRAVHAAARHPTVKEINDRKGYLAFKHRVWRFELQLRALEPELYRRLLALMRQADSEKWSRLRKKSKKGRVYPEVEYIDYDVEHWRKPCFIEPHVDNKSAVTLVAMLSPSTDYVGGRSCFRRSGGRAGHRELPLQMGDAVLFRGEKLVHWITPVTSGRRVILQIELSRV